MRIAPLFGRGSQNRGPEQIFGFQGKFGPVLGFRGYSLGSLKGCEGSILKEDNPYGSMYRITGYLGFG